MTESSANGHSSQTGADDTSLTGLFRSWLRTALRGKSETTWRETIGELIEDNGDSATTVAAHERMLLSNILQLRDLTAIDVMVPRADIMAIDIETPLMEALKRSPTLCRGFTISKVIQWSRSSPSRQKKYSSGGITSFLGLKPTG